MFMSASEADEHDSASHNPDLPVLKRQETEAVQSGASQEPATTRTSTAADTTGILTQPNGNHTITTHISSAALNHTTAPPTSAAPPTSTVSTDSSILTLSIHSPDLSLATSSTHISQTSLTTDTASLTSGLSSSTAQATPTAAQSSPLIPHTIPSSIAASSNSFISKTSTRPTATTAAATAADSTRISSSASTHSTVTSPTTSFNEASTTSTPTYFESFGPTGSLGGFAGGGAGGSGSSTTGSSAGPTATDSQPPQDSGLSPTTNKIVGGVVGSVAGVAFLFLVALLYLRRRHASLREARQALPSGDAAGGAAGEGSTTQSAEMTSRRSSYEPLFSASYLAPAFMRSWRKSNQTTNTDSSLVSNSSERGFQKISGRKIASVLQSGGDGYGGGFGDNPPPGPEMSMTFQPVSAAHLRTPTSQPPTANPHGMPLDVNYTREGGESDPRVVVRPSPARTPVASSTNIASTHTPTSPRSTPEPPRVSSPTGPRRPDILGRSHPSFDGSRSSRFTEGL
ncbi:hypothetical protein PHISP_07043 [Aspergillus sp. HF37]|nr:hypothetical protein PHISP_07043 [Aspergillus sp. HF37]